MSAATIDALDLLAEILAAPPTQYEVLLPTRPPAPIRIAMRAAADLEPLLRCHGGPEVWHAVHHVACRLRQRADELDAAAEAMAAVWERPTLGALRQIAQEEGVSHTQVKRDLELEPDVPAQSGDEAPEPDRLAGRDLELTRRGSAQSGDEAPEPDRVAGRDIELNDRRSAQSGDEAPEPDRVVGRDGGQVAA